MSALLPDLKDLDVLDAGCGTGRMLSLLKTRNPRSLMGVDSSQAMVERARSTHGAEVRFGSCTALPLADASVDYLVSSFVLSYISDLEAFADEVQRVTRSGAAVLLSDIHPDTARALNWKRSFRWSGQEIEVQSEGWRYRTDSRRVCCTWLSRPRLHRTGICVARGGNFRTSP